MNKKIRYNVINCIVLLICAVLFYKNFGFQKIENWIAFVGIAIVVYGIKAFRLYFIMFGQGVSISRFLKQYCKLILVSIIIPFKLGELFRIYCYGYQMNNYLHAAVAIILDRFIDTLALVCILIFFALVNGLKLSGIIYFLVWFLICVLILYLIYPEMHQFWKHYFLTRTASKKGNQMLELMENMNEAYISIREIAKGKNIVLFILSIIAWSVEIGGVLLIYKMAQLEMDIEVIMDYLTAALTGTENLYLGQFVSVSVLLMIGLYVLFYIVTSVTGKGKSVCK